MTQTNGNATANGMPWRYAWLDKEDTTEDPVMAANTHADIAAVAEALERHGLPATYVYETEGDVHALRGVGTHAAEAEMGRLLFDVSRRTGEVVLVNGAVVNVLEPARHETTRAASVAQHELQPSTEELREDLYEAVRNAHRECIGSRQRVGTEARAIRAALRVWLDEINRSAGHVEGLLKDLEGWSEGAPLPDDANRLLDCTLEHDPGDPIPFAAFDNLAHHLALDAATQERPESVHSLELGGVCIRPDLWDWQSQIADVVAKQMDVGFSEEGGTDELKRAAAKAFVDAMNASASATEREAAE